MKHFYRYETKHVGGPFAAGADLEEALLEYLQMGGDDIVVGDSAYDIDDVSGIPDPEDLLKAAKAATRLLKRLSRNGTTDAIEISAIIVRLQAEIEKYR